MKSELLKVVHECILYIFFFRFTDFGSFQLFLHIIYARYAIILYFLLSVVTCWHLYSSSALGNNELQWFIYFYFPKKKYCFVFIYLSGWMKMYLFSAWSCYKISPPVRNGTRNNTIKKNNSGTLKNNISSSGSKNK
jgi:hypothetical protein